MRSDKGPLKLRLGIPKGWLGIEAFDAGPEAELDVSEP